MLGGSARNVVRRMSSLAAPQVEASLLDGLLNRSKMPQVPLDIPFPGVPALHAEAGVAKHAVQTTKLPNGLRVVSVDSNSPIASVGAFIDAGSRYESPEMSGVSHFLEYFAFGSTTSRSDFRMTRDMQKMGANVVCSTSREHTVYAADCLREFTPGALHTLADVIQNPEFDSFELKQAKEQYKTLVSEKLSQPDVQVMEAIHAAAYHNNTLGLPHHAPHNLGNFTAESLTAHMKEFFVPSRMVVSGVGIDHDSLVKIVEKEFTFAGAAAAPVTQKARYTGGDVRLHSAEDHTVHLALAFETANWSSKDLVPMCVLQTMMGGGGAFSAGGPGKGMYSRLYQNVLNQHHWVESANCFNSLFADSSLFGMYGTCHPQQAVDLVDVLTREFIRMAGPVDATELARAKTQLQSSVHMQLEQRTMVLEDLGRQTIAYDKFESASEVCAKIAAVTADDIKRVAATMMKTAPSVAVCGNLSHAPRYDDISRHFG